MRKYLLLILIAFFTSCEFSLFEADRGSTDPFVVFDYLWQEVDRKYSYFQLKSIDWDQVRAQYRPLIREWMSEEELFQVLADMLNELRDDHTNLIAPFNISRYDVALQNPPNYLERTVQEFYIPRARITGGFVHDTLAGGEIAYVRYSSFMLPVTDDVLDHILTRYENTRGMIIDMRANGGGNVFYIPILLSRFTSERRLAAYSITRNGPGRNDFSERQPFHINAHNGIRYNKPVVVLIDRGSYSATTMFALMTKVFPNITLMGDTTGGGGGLPNGGQLPNGWTYRFSISQILDLSGNNYAEDGVAPDVFAAFDWSDLTRDEIIDQAVSLLTQ